MKTGIIFGWFDLLHAGHLVLLEEARRQCDYLIVGLKAAVAENSKGNDGALQTVVERYIKLEGCKYVDEIIPYTSAQDMLDMLQTLPVTTRFVGEEYRNRDFIDKAYCQDAGIEIVYIRRCHRFSSNSLKKIVSFKEFTKPAGMMKAKLSLLTPLSNHLANA